MRWVYDARVPPPSTRARALGLARRLAAGALGRLAREVDRISAALGPIREARVLGEPSPRIELEVSRAVHGPRAPSSALPMHPAVPPAAAPPARAVPDPRAPIDHLREHVDAHLEVLRDLAAWDRAEGSTTAVHRLRVATRRLRAFTRAFAPVIGHKRARKLDRRLRAVTRGLGPVRELDVLLEGLRRRQAEADPLARGALEHVAAWAEARRRKAVTRARAAVADTDAHALAAAIEAELDRACGWLARPDGHAEDRIRSLVEPALARAFEGMPRPTHEDELDALHEVRIRTKQLRYVLDLLRPWLEEAHHALRRPLKRVQSTLGVHRDAAQLTACLHARGASLRARGMPTLAQALASIEATAHRGQTEAFEDAMRALEGLDADQCRTPTTHDSTA